VNIKSKRSYFQENLLLVAMMASAATTVFADSSDNKLKQVDPKILVAANDTNSAKPQKASLYTRLGGYDAIAAVINDTMPRLIDDKKLGRFWANRGADGIKREKQLVIDFIVNQAGGPLNYGGRDMNTSHKGMKISDEDWKIFMGHLNMTLEKFKVPGQEKTDVVAFMESLKGTMVE
jgi:hemoglobin